MKTSIRKFIANLGIVVVAGYPFGTSVVFDEVVDSIVVMVIADLDTIMLIKVCLLLV